MAISNVALAPPLASAQPKRRQEPGPVAAIGRFLRRNPLVVVGGVIVFAWIVVSVAAPALTPFAPLTQRIQDRLQAPSATHPFGTDVLGRDVLSRVLYGGRISLPVGFGVVAVSLLIGGVIGALAGFGAGLLESGVVRGPRVVMAFRIILLAV